MAARIAVGIRDASILGLTGLPESSWLCLLSTGVISVGYSALGFSCELQRLNSGLHVGVVSILQVEPTLQPQ